MSVPALSRVLGVPYVFAYDAGAVAWSNDAAQHSLFAALTSIGRDGAMKVGDTIEVDTVLRHLNNTGAGQTLTIATKLGTVSYGSWTSGTLATSANTRRVSVNLKFICKAVGVAGGAGIVAVIGTVAISQPSTLASFDTLSAAGTIAVGGHDSLSATTDASSAQNLDVLATMSTATAGGTVTPGPLVVRYWPRLL